MPNVKIALVGAGSRSFGPATIRDILLSDSLASRGIELTLMDIDEQAVNRTLAYACHVRSVLGRSVEITATTSLEEALQDASFVVDAVEISRDAYWAMDFHVPRRFGFKQIYGENGGPGSLFHALRNMPPIVRIAKEMERRCPEALLLNYTNPMHKLCTAACRLTRTKTIGLCHGVFMGRHQIAFMLGVPEERLETSACGINHFTWFQSIRDHQTGEDLYPALRAADREGDWLSDWHEIGLSRILFRRFGLYPSPGTNHIGEYIGWASDFYANELLWYYDPVDGHPWDTGRIPEFVYSLGGDKTGRPFRPVQAEEEQEAEESIQFSGEGAIPIMESLACDVRHDLPAINVPNEGAIPGLPEDLIVEVPAVADCGGWTKTAMQPLPEPVAAMIRTQASIQDLLVEAYVEESKEKLLQAIFLEPTVDSYRRAVEMMDEMLRLQADILPPLR